MTHSMMQTMRRQYNDGTLFICQEIVFVVYSVQNDVIKWKGIICTIYLYDGYGHKENLELYAVWIFCFATQIKFLDTFCC